MAEENKLTGEKRKKAELRAYKPTFRDRLGAFIAGDSKPGQVRNNLAQGLVGSAGVSGTGTGLGDFTPAGIPLAASDVGAHLGDGDYTNAGLAAAGLVLPAAKAGSAGVKAGIRAYHGSPHDFDKFSLEHIGRGEGAQSFGRGLYFAEKEEVAKTYRNNLSPGHFVTRDGKKYNYALDLEDDVVKRLPPEAPEQTKYPLLYALSLMQSGRDLDAAFDKAQKAYAHFDPQMLADAKTALYSAHPEYKSAGKMYEVNIDAKPEEFLQWDKPLGEQSPQVSQALESLPGFNDQHKLYQTMNIQSGDLMKRGLLPQTYDIRGETFRKSYDEAGIKGIRYKDRNSRFGEDDTHNLVVFNDRLIDIMRKYGLLAPFGLGVAGASLPHNNLQNGEGQ